MPIFDPFEQRMALRVVYDGVACAGKTTNLRQLSVLFAAQRASELHSPADLRGRTLYFDWLTIPSGMICGFPLVCQVVSVPGQVVLTPRRRHLIATADVVVYVCESGESTVGAARAGLALYDEVVGAADAAIPLIVQANKQDHAGALDGAALLRALGREAMQVVEAIASDGIGVIDTFVAAVRAAARNIRTRAERDALRVEVRRAETASEVLARLARERIDPEWAAEMLLEEAAAALPVDEAFAAVAADSGGLAAAAAAASELAPSEPAHVAPQRDDSDAPPLPSPDVPTGFIWPAHTGRRIIRSLELSSAAAPAFGSERAAVVRVKGFEARTSARARFGDRESARQALVRAARQCTQLDRLLVPDTVLVAQPSAAESCWIWTVRPAVPSLTDALETGALEGDVLRSFGAALVDALRMSLRHGVSLALSIEAFGVHNRAIRYLGEIVAEPPSADVLSRSILAIVDALERAGADVEVFLESFAEERNRQLTDDERARAGLLPRRRRAACERGSEAT